jgi:hypothetical protein
MVDQMAQRPLDPIVEAVRAKLLRRSQIGLTKYGVALNRTDLTRIDWLRHAQEEAMDLANYLEVLIQMEITSPPHP